MTRLANLWHRFQGEHSGALLARTFLVCCWSLLPLGSIAVAGKVESGAVDADPKLVAPKSETSVVTSKVTPAVELPQAESVDLSDPLDEAVAEVSVTTDASSMQPVNAPVVAESPAPVAGETRDGADARSPVGSAVQMTPLVLLGTEVPPATSTRLSWKPDQSFEGIAMPTPVLVVNGARPGPTVCLTAAVHGDELNGIEIVRRVLYEAKAEKLAGALIGVPIVNLHGFHRTSRYLPDRRDLNRFFPGDPRGSSASRIAYSFFHEVIDHCDALVDLHTGSFHRTNLPQVRADLTDPAIVELSQSFGATVVLHSTGREGTLRRAAAEAGIPAITLEAGEPSRLQQAAVDHGVKGIETLLDKMEMYERVSFWGDPEPVFYNSEWIRADRGGILFSEVKVGQNVNAGELLGTVTDPITNVRTEIHTPFNGRVLGRALDQVVMPGFAAFRIGIVTSEEEVQQEGLDDSPGDTEVGLNAAPQRPDAATILKRARARMGQSLDDDNETLEASE